MNKEYDKLLNWKVNLVSSKMSLSDKEKIIESYKESRLPIPKKVLLEDLFEKMRADLLYVCDCIANSPARSEGLDDYILAYIEGPTFFELDELQLIAFSDELFVYTQKLKMKLVSLNKQFNDDDWYALKDILDEYEVY